jgi:hypothetical protein
MTSENSIILKRLRSMKVRRNEAYRTWLKSRYPKGYHFCHILGSTSRSLKLNDLLAVCKPAEEHLYVDHMGKGNFINDLMDAIGNLQKYIWHLGGEPCTVDLDTDDMENQLNYMYDLVEKLQKGRGHE